MCLQHPPSASRDASQAAAPSTPVWLPMGVSHHAPLSTQPLPLHTRQHAECVCVLLLALPAIAAPPVPPFPSGVRGAHLQHKHALVCVCRQAVGEHAASRATADDNVVILVTCCCCYCHCAAPGCDACTGGRQRRAHPHEQRGSMKLSTTPKDVRAVTPRCWAREQLLLGASWSYLDAQHSCVQFGAAAAGDERGWTASWGWVGGWSWTEWGCFKGWWVVANGVRASKRGRLHRSPV